MGGTEAGAARGASRLSLRDASRAALLSLSAGFRGQGPGTGRALARSGSARCRAPSLRCGRPLQPLHARGLMGVRGARLHSPPPSGSSGAGPVLSWVRWSALLEWRASLGKRARGDKARPSWAPDPLPACHGPAPRSLSSPREEKRPGPLRKVRQTSAPGTSPSAAFLALGWGH